MESISFPFAAFVDNRIFVLFFCSRPSAFLEKLLDRENVLRFKHFNKIV